MSDLILSYNKRMILFLARLIISTIGRTDKSRWEMKECKRMESIATTEWWPSRNGENATSNVYEVHEHVACARTNSASEWEQEEEEATAAKIVADTYGCGNRYTNVWRVNVYRESARSCIQLVWRVVQRERERLSFSVYITPEGTLSHYTVSKLIDLDLLPVRFHRTCC